jgi:MFS family permease
VIFGGGSILATLAGSASELITSRALMGVGAAGIMPTTLSIITNIFPSSERPKAIAVAASNVAFVDAMTTTATIAAVVAVVGALIAAVFLPAPARTDNVGAELAPAAA